METDTGAFLSFVNDKTFETLHKRPEELTLHKTHTSMHTFSGNQIHPKEVMGVPVHDKDGQETCLPLAVVSDSQSSLLGWDWLERLQLYWREVKMLSTALLSTAPSALLAQYPDLFEVELGELKGVKATIHMDQAAGSQFYRA